MNCEICGEEVENSEDLNKHMEKMHAMADQKPEVETEESPKPAEEPEPAPIPGRM